MVTLKFVFNQEKLKQAGTPGRFAKPELTQKMKPKHRSR